MSKNYDTGKQGEEEATAFLIKNGYQILERNWHFKKAEVDIIAENEGYLVFVEVKTREANTYGNPEDFVSRKQQKLLLNAANQYVDENPTDKELRMDIIAITLHPHYNLEHIEEAFYP